MASYRVCSEASGAWERSERGIGRYQFPDASFESFRIIEVVKLIPAIDIALRFVPHALIPSLQ
jgi:hypothetical protein